MLYFGENMHSKWVYKNHILELRPTEEALHPI